MEKTLQMVIIEVLQTSTKSLTVGQITDIIKERKLWFRPSDSELPNRGQVAARVNKYPEFFTLQNSIVVLNNKNKGDNRLCKIVWNSNYWIKPMERSWNPSFIGDTSKSHEKKHGFVHEDWLFNPKFIFEGYQYGFIEGFEKLNVSVTNVETVYLFTLNLNSKERFYVGKLNKVEKLNHGEIKSNILKAIRSFEKDMVKELKDSGADYKKFRKDHFNPNLRFKVADKEIFPTPLPIVSNWFFTKYFRCNPFKMNNELYDLFNKLERKLQFVFVPSSPEHKSGGYDKHTKEGATQVDKVHDEIEKSLYNFLLEKGINKSQIACDTTSFGGKLADVVVKLDATNFDIYEIKTDTDLRRGLREAIGQLLDYATWEKDIAIKNICAVLPHSPLSDNIKDFIHRLQKNVHFNFKVLFYDKTTKTFLSM